MIHVSGGGDSWWHIIVDKNEINKDLRSSKDFGAVVKKLLTRINVFFIPIEDEHFLKQITIFKEDEQFPKTSRHWIYLSKRW